MPSPVGKAFCFDVRVNIWYTEKNFIFGVL